MGPLRLVAEVLALGRAIVAKVPPPDPEARRMRLALRELRVRLRHKRKMARILTRAARFATAVWRRSG